MFDIDASKLLIVGVFALIFLGPKELPRVMRQVGNAVGKLRRMAGDFQGQFMDAMREAELDDIKKEVAKLGDSARIDVPTLDPGAEIRKAIDSGGLPEDPNAPPPATAAGDPEPFKPIDLNVQHPDPPAPATSESIAAELRAGDRRDANEETGEEITFRTPPPERATVPVASAEPGEAAPRRRSARPAGA